MFNEILDFEGYLESLKLDKILSEHDKDFTGDYLNNGDYYSNAWETVVNLASEWVELEKTCSTLYKFCFPEMIRFYELCREHSKIMGINFKKNPFVLNAMKKVAEIMRYSSMDNYYFDWNIWVPKKVRPKHNYTFIIETSMDFFSHIEMVETVYEVKEYYAEALRTIEKALEIKPKIVKMSEVNKEVKAA